MDISKKRLHKELQSMVDPIDFKALEEAGIMSKVGAWYKVSNVHKLPDNVRSKVIETKGDRQGNTLIKLKKTIKREEALLTKMD